MGRLYRYTLPLTFLILALIVPVPAPAQGDAHPRGWKQGGFAFVENRGQTVDANGRARSDIRFTAGDRGVRLYFTQTGLSYVFTVADRRGAKLGPERLASERTRTYRLDMELVGANPDARIEPGKPGEDYLNFYLPHCPDGITGVRSYGALTYHDIYEKIDLVFHGDSNGLKYDFIVRPGGDPGDIRLRYAGASDIDTDRDGALHISTPLGALVEGRPIAWQPSPEGDRGVACAYRIEGETVRFDAGTYDAARTLVIDPPVAWSTYYGGVNEDVITKSAADRDGNVLFTGYTESLTDFPVFGGNSQPNDPGASSAFVVKMDASGRRQWATYYGGSAWEYGGAIAIDIAGNAVVVGSTLSTDFPLAGNAFQQTSSGATDAFIVKLGPDGRRLWATYYGGSESDYGYDIAATPSGGFAIAGQTRSINLRVSADAFQPSSGGGGDAFVVLFDAGNARSWGTYFGGLEDDHGWGIAVDRTGSVVVVGGTSSLDLPVSADAHQPALAAAPDAFIARFDSRGRRRWATYYGGDGSEMDGYPVYDWGSLLQSGKVAVDTACNVWLTGGAIGTGLPVSADAFQRTKAGVSDAEAFLIKLDSTGRRQWATYFGGTGDDFGNAVTIDACGNAIIVGGTTSTTLAVTSDAPQTNSAGGWDAFIAKFDPRGQRLWASYHGGTGTDYGTAIASVAGLDVLSGITTSGDLPVSSDAFQKAHKGAADIPDGFMTAVGSRPVLDITVTGSLCNGDSVTLTATDGYASYRWSTGALTRIIKVGKAGRYYVVVRDACDAVSTDSIDVRDGGTPPVITGSRPATLCIGDSIILSVGVYSSYQWSTGETTPTITVKQSGTYFVTTTDAAGCVARSDDFVVTVGATLEPVITTIGPTSFCTGDSVILDAGPGYDTYHWTPTNETTQQIVVKGSGSYSVKVTRGSCDGNSTPVTLSVRTAQTPVITASGPLSFCEGDSVQLDAGPAFRSFLWSTGATTQTIMVKGAGRYWVRTTDGNGCSITSAEVVVTHHPAPVPTIVTSGPTTICEGDSVKLAAPAGFNTYLWSTGERTQSITVRSNGAFIVTVVDSRGCQGVSPPTTVTVRPLPSPSLNPAGPIMFCEGDSVVLDGPPGYTTYLWSNGATTRSIVVKTGGRYSVTVGDDIGCEGRSNEVEVIAHPTPPLPTLSQTGEELIATPPGSYQWHRDGTPIPGATGDRYRFSLAGAYTVSVVTANGCMAVSAPFSPNFEEIASSIISIPTLTAAPGQRVTVPLMLENSYRLDEADVHTFSATIRFNRRTLVPVPGGPTGTVAGDDRVISVQGTRQGATGTLAQIELLAVLGDAASIPLVIESFAWTDGRAAVSTTNGVLNLDSLCLDGGARLVDAEGALGLKPSRPDPARDATEIEYEIVEDGITRLYVTDLRGLVVARVVEAAQTPGRYVAHLDVSNLSSGLYFCILETPTERLVRPMRVE